MLSCGLQVLHRRELSVFGVIQTGFAVIVPDREDAAHGDVGLPMRQLIIALAECQQTEQDGIDLDRFGTGALIDIIHADDAFIGIAVVAVEQLMHIQIQFMHVSRLRGERILVFGVADQRDDRIERIHKDSAVFVHIRTAGQSEGSQNEQEQRKSGGFFHGKYNLQRSGFSYYNKNARILQVRAAVRD